jgi:hypothetical protein
MTAASSAKAGISRWREAGAQALVFAGAAGAILSIAAGWSGTLPAPGGMLLVTDSFLRAMQSLFGAVANPFGATVSSEATLALSFISFYLMLGAGSLLLDRDDGDFTSRMQNFLRLLVVSYIVWPAIFLFSFAMRLATFSGTPFTMIVFLCSVALCHVFINSLVRIDIESLGLMLLYLLANLRALDAIGNVINGANSAAVGGYTGALLEVVMTLSVVMVLLLPAVLAPSQVFRKSAGFIVLAAAITLGAGAAWEFDYSKLNLWRSLDCCHLKAPWPDPDAKPPGDGPQQ